MEPNPQIVQQQTGSCLQNEAWTCLQPQMLEGSRSSRWEEKATARNSLPNLSPPRNVQDTQPRACVPGSGYMTPFLYTFPRSLVLYPAFLKEMSWELGGGFSGLCVTDGQRHCSNVRKKTSYPKLYKHTLHSLNVFVKYWKHLELHSVMQLKWTHTHLCKARWVLGMGLSRSSLSSSAAGGLTGESWKLGFSFSGDIYRNVD